MGLKEILEDAANNDALEFVSGNNKITFGELRGMSKSIAEQTRAAEAKRQQAEQLASEAATLLEQLQAAGKQPAKPADGTYDWKKDPLYAPVVGELTALQELAKRALDSAEAQKKSLEQTASIYAYERLKSEYERAPESFRKKYAEFDKVAAEAINGKEFDRFGLPTLSRRIQEATEPDRIKAATDIALVDARKQWEAEQRASDARPGAAARFHTEKGKEAPIKRIEDLTSDMVANDPDVQAAMRGETVQ